MTPILIGAQRSFSLFFHTFPLDSAAAEMEKGKTPGFWMDMDRRHFFPPSLYDLHSSYTKPVV